MMQNLENVIENIVSKKDHSDFIYDLLLAYGISKTTITKAKKDIPDLFGNRNQIILKKKVFFEQVDTGVNVLNRLDELQKDENSYSKDPRFIIVTDFKDIAAYDTKTKEAPLVVPFKELYKHSEFFLPWAGREKYEAHLENPADVKAAGKMAKIYDEIYNNDKSFAQENNHALNVFLVRLLFCFFAEDTGIFDGDNIFTEAISNHTLEDGSDLSSFFDSLFESLDKRDKSLYPSYIQQFPYVNGHLFADKCPIPKLTAKARRLILECGDQNNWAEINPDIFGSMFQAVKDAKVRSGLGQHYTSVPNIMKVINPLFMDDLREDFKDAYNDVKKLQKLLLRLSKIRIFDPACGSGNFLIIALKQLKLLEIQIIKRLSELNKNLDMKMNLSGIQLRNFHGIEIDDFACQIARLSLWLAEHQMNCKFKEEFGVARPTLPLTESGHIVCGNACRMDWEKVCSPYLERSFSDEFVNAELQNTPMKLNLPREEAEVYILGNPPYYGSKLQTIEQKGEVKSLLPNSRDLDYISCWFILAAQYIQKSEYAVCGFVSTNSIVQGEQVDSLWNPIFKLVEIYFAYKSFKWTNNAKNNAGVTCVIIGMRGINTKNARKKYIYDDNGKKQVDNINCYLNDGTSVFIRRINKTMSGFPKMSFGSMPRDGGNLIFTAEEKTYMCSINPKIGKFIKRYVGADDYINGLERYCLWIEPEEALEALSYKPISERTEKVCVFRQSSKAPSTQAYANKSYMFVQRAYKPTNAIIVPRVSSERRKYIPIGFVDKNVIISDSAQAIYDAEVWLFGVLTSYMHMVWVNAVGGKLETRIRYSAELCYNTFPFPKITEAQRKKIELYANNILEVREKYFNKTLAELYDPDKMPKDLAEVHHNLDLCIESCYRKRPFENDDQRLKHLFKMYELMSSGAKDDDLKQLELL